MATRRPSHARARGRRAARARCVARGPWVARVALALAVALAGCATPWDPPGLRRHRAALEAHPGQRLFDATPYLLPARGELVEFFCRWPDGRPIPIHLPEDATPDERRALDAAVAAWASAGIGVRFEPVSRERALQGGIEISFLAPDHTTRAEGTGYTLADCRLADASPAALARAVLPASMERARIRIVRRDSRTWSPADHAFFAGEVAGVALHELAHALGFQGHTHFDDGILARDTRHSTVVGRRVLAGEAFHEPTVAALYELPSGIVLVRHPVPRVRTALLDALLDALRGPLVRVGDRSGRIFWRTASGGEEGVTLVSVVEARAKPDRLVLLPDQADG